MDREPSTQHWLNRAAIVLRRVADAEALLLTPTTNPSGSQDAIDGFQCAQDNQPYSSKVWCSWTATVLWGVASAAPNAWYGGPGTAFVTRKANGSVVVQVGAQVCTLTHAALGACT